MIDYAAKIREWREHPATMVRELFHVEPDPWQAEVLDAFPTSPRIARATCKGAGKTALLAWIGWNFLLTYPLPRGIALAPSPMRLADNLWAELAKWRQECPLLADRFQWTPQRITSVENPMTWWLRAGKEPKWDSVMGLEGEHLLYLFDDSGGLDAALADVARSSDAPGVEHRIVQMGVPLWRQKPDMPPIMLEQAEDNPLWNFGRVSGAPDDPDRAPRVRVEWARDMIEQYGAGNAWVRSNVFAEFSTGIDFPVWKKEKRKMKFTKGNSFDLLDQLAAKLDQQPQDEVQIRAQCLSLALSPIAVSSSDSQETVLDRAKAYADFVLGQLDKNTA